MRRNLPSFAVWRAVEGEDVVAGLGLGGLPDAKRQVVVVHERLAARVLRQREERVLRPLQARDLPAARARR